jgi:hypothetical protein
MLMNAFAFMLLFVGGSINFVSVGITKMQILEIFLGKKKNKTLPCAVSNYYRYQEQHKSIKLSVILFCSIVTSFWFCG